MWSVKLPGFLVLVFFLGFHAFAQTAAPAYNQALLDELVYRANFGRADDVKILLERGAPPDGLDKQGKPIIAIAAGRSDAEGVRIVEALVAAGANVNTLDRNKVTPIFHAVRNNNVGVVKFLLGNGADFTLKDAHGRSLLNIAKVAGNKEIVAAIQKAIDAENARVAALRSPRNFSALNERYAMTSCAYQYDAYYLSSGMAQGKEKLDVETRIQTERETLTATAKDLITYFPRMDKEHFSRISGPVMQKMKRDLDDMISNRNRRAKGVGKPGDMEARCGKIVSESNVLLIVPPPNP